MSHPHRIVVVGPNAKVKGGRGGGGDGGEGASGMADEEEEEGAIRLLPPSCLWTPVELGHRTMKTRRRKEREEEEEDAFHFEVKWNARK